MISRELYQSKCVTCTTGPSQSLAQTVQSLITAVLAVQRVVLEVSVLAVTKVHRKHTSAFLVLLK